MSRFYFSAMLVRTLLLLLCTAMAAHGSDSESPPSTTTLTDENFDAHVFAPRSTPRAWLIFFYAPWCGHCKTMLPLFFNVSQLLDAGSVPHAKFGVVDAVRHKALAHRFNVHEYPTFVYTTGKAKRWSRFQGASNALSFAQFATYLQRGVEAGSFADVLTDPQVFAGVEQQMANARVPMYVYVPPHSASSAVRQTMAESRAAESASLMNRRRTESRDALWNAAIDAAASIGNIRFGVLFADDIPTRWEEFASASYVTVVRAAQNCIRNGKAHGPRGEALVVHSDAFRLPQCYGGVWLDDSGGLHAELATFIARSGFRAVEPAAPGLFAIASTQDHWYVALFVTHGPDALGEAAVLPVLREIVRERNARESDEAAKKTQARRITIAHANAHTDKQWIMRYRIEEKELPALIVVDPRRDKVFRMHTHVPGFETVKAERPWRLGGKQQEMIRDFLDDVEAGRVEGEKMTLFGTIADYLALLPGMEFVYSTLGYQDALFVTLTLGVAFSVSLLIFVICVEPAMERRMEAEGNQKKSE